MTKREIFETSEKRTKVASVSDLYLEKRGKMWIKETK
jgi:hypothetical protein